VQADYPQPDLRYDLITGSGANPYAGLDRFGRTTDLLWRDYGASTDVDRFQYSYDRNSNRLSKENTVAVGGFDELYGNDALNRLLQFNRGDLNDTKKKVTEPTWLQSWNLDPTGNWSGYTNIEPAVPANTLVQERRHNAANEIDPLGLVSTAGATWGMVTENRAGNMAAAPKPLSPTGELALGWDAWNRLRLAFEPFTSNVVIYQRDALNRKIVETVGETARHCYYSTDWQDLEERLNSSTDPAIQNVWGLRYIDDLILRDCTVSDPLDERLYACQDALFSVTTLVEPDGDVAQRFAYTPYGVSQTLSPSFTPDTDSYAWTTRFTGRALDLTLGLYDYRMRSYHTQLGRFLSRDPVDYASGTNLYEYVYDSPLNWLDPSGEQAAPRLAPSLPRSPFPRIYRPPSENPRNGGGAAPNTPPNQGPSPFRAPSYGQLLEAKYWEEYQRVFGKLPERPVRDPRGYGFGRPSPRPSPPPSPPFPELPILPELPPLPRNLPSPQPERLGPELPPTSNSNDCPNPPPLPSALSRPDGYPTIPITRSCCLQTRCAGHGMLYGWQVCHYYCDGWSVEVQWPADECCPAPLMHAVWEHGEVPRYHVDPRTTRPPRLGYTDCMNVFCRNSELKSNSGPCPQRPRRPPRTR